MQKIFFIIALVWAPLAPAMELPEKPKQSWSAEPSENSILQVLPDIRFPVAVSENAPACVYASFECMGHQYAPQISWSVDSDLKAEVNVSHMFDGLYILARRPMITPDGSVVFGMRNKESMLKMVLHYRSVDNGEAQYPVDFNSEYYTDINSHNKPVIDTLAPYACLIDSDRIFFRSLKSVFVCTIAALKQKEKNLFKVPWYKRTDSEYYPSFEREYPRINPCQLLSKNTVLVVGPESRSLEVLQCGDHSCVLSAERIFNTEIVDVKTAPTRGIVAIRFDYDDRVKIFDTQLNMLGEILFNTEHGVVPTGDSNRFFAFAPSGNYLAYVLSQKDDRNDVIVIVNCGNVKNPKEVMVIPNMTCYDMIWSSQGLYLHTFEGGGGRLVFKSA